MVANPRIFFAVSVKGVIARFFVRILAAFLCLLFSSTVLYAQLTVDDGLPPGWENWESECGQSGGLDACQNLGKIWVFGVERPANISKGAEYFFKACEIYKDLESCAMTIEYARDQSPNPELYEKTLNVGCKLKEFRYCIELYGGVRPSPVLYKLSLGAACNAGDPDVCDVAAIAFNPNKKPALNDPAPDINFAVKWGKRGCELGSGYACKSVGQAYAGFLSKKPTLPKNTQEGLSWFRKACQLKYGSACMEIFDYATGSAQNLGRNDDVTISKDDIKMALKYGCEDQFPQMCLRAAGVYHTGELNMTPNPLKAVKYAIAACYAEDKYYEGFGTPDFYRGHIRKACDYAAALTAEAYGRTGELTFDDILTAKRGCEFGSALSCYQQGRSEIIHERYDAGTASMRKSCKLGDSNACDWVESEAARERKEREARLARAAAQEKARQDRLAQLSEQQNYSSNATTNYYSSYTPPSRSYIAPNTNRSYAAQESSAAIYQRVRVQTRQTYCNTGGTYGC